MKATSMADYAPGDFQRYYGGATFLHPSTQQVCMVVDIDPNGLTYIQDMQGNSLPRVPHNELTFEMFQERPALGYRHLEGGKYLYYISRRAMRQTGKGIRPNTIAVSRVGEVSRLHDLAGTGNTYTRGAQYSTAIVEAIYNPNYMSLKDSVHELRNGAALGCALDHRFAVTLLTTEGDCPFVLLYKGQRAAFSREGDRWLPTHPEFVELIERRLPSIVLEK